MKKILTIVIVMGTLLFSGCKKWLDVKPQGENTQEELFKTQKGFRDALTGAYLRMKGGNVYGGAMMWGNIEYMAQNWDNPSTANQALSALVAGNYTNSTVIEWLDNTYRDLYKVIADANGVLINIDEKRGVFSDGNYELIKGESLALRAFCHFDALRMYGPIPNNPGALKILPYVKNVSKEITEPLVYREFVQAILADLDQAELLLKDIDPIRKYSIAQLNPAENASDVIGDNFLMYRQVRMNYYAVLALKARVYMWLSAANEAEKLNAAKYAKMVMDAVDPAGLPLFRLGQESDRAAEDYTMSPEHIAALSVYNLESIANGAFTENGAYQRYDFNITDGFYYINNLFPVAERVADIRWKGMWTYKTGSGKTNYVMYKKFIQKNTLPKFQVLQIPLIRLSEMYLISTECADNKTAAEQVYAAYCAKKGIPFTAFNAADWTGDRKNKMIREYVREFYAEGQTFFTYKRYNVSTLPQGWTYAYYNAKPEKYLVPKPLRELNYNNN
ncbi:RagB/SusD family nutrient uptake outer membrane protein [Pedobacter sp. GR22-6]|uniref:RagB/SusD family nutrient uptake outer membrane protein n=1 Tax=Pedobacter sp. GR22-6 TaxID=3127957 RepID=UPI00307ED4A2